MKKMTLAFILACAGIMYSCQKFPSVTDVDGEFLVSTSYAEDTDFSKYTTFTIADSILVLDSYMGCDTIKNASTDKLVGEYRKMLEERGYTYVPKEDDVPVSADLAVQLSYVADTDYYTEYVNPYWWLDYPGYWSSYYWGAWGGGWYYPYPVTYRFTTHSLMADMADLTAPTGENESLPVIWSCFINGSAGSSRDDLQKFVDAIDQAFAQSEYLAAK